MKKMECIKKVTALGTAALLALSLAGCGQSGTVATQKTDTGNYPES